MRPRRWRPSKHLESRVERDSLSCSPPGSIGSDRAKLLRQFRRIPARTVTEPQITEGKSCSDGGDNRIPSTTGRNANLRSDDLQIVQSFIVDQLCNESGVPAQDHFNLL